MNKQGGRSFIKGGLLANARGGGYGSPWSVDDGGLKIKEDVVPGAEGVVVGRGRRGDDGFGEVCGNLCGGWGCVLGNTDTNMDERPV